jgi:prevent-host-death family protein
MTWQLQDAKNKLSEVVDTSISKGPQIISRRGRNTAVVISYEEYQTLKGEKLSVKDALMALDISQLDLKRDKSVNGRTTAIKLI